MVNTSIPQEVSDEIRKWREFKRCPAFNYECGRLLSAFDNPGKLTGADLKRLTDKSDVPEYVKTAVKRDIDDRHAAHLRNIPGHF